MTDPILPVARPHRRSVPQRIRESGWAGKILATIGVAVVLFEIVLHIVGYFTGVPYEVNHVVLLVGTIFGFVGFFMLDPKKTSEGTTILVRSGVEIINSLPRFGRRKTDAVALPTAETTVTAEPVPEDHAGDPPPEKPENPAP